MQIAVSIDHAPDKIVRQILEHLSKGGPRNADSGMNDSLASVSAGEICPLLRGSRH